jgi:hypothetical protein
MKRIIASINVQVSDWPWTVHLFTQVNMATLITQDANTRASWGNEHEMQWVHCTFMMAGTTPGAGVLGKTSPITS